MQRELEALFPQTRKPPPARIDNSERSAPLDADGIPVRPPLVLNGMKRKMVEHQLPPYAECNFRKLQFIFTREPRQADFPRERLYRKDSLDLLFRHFYKAK